MRNIHILFLYHWAMENDCVRPGVHRAEVTELVEVRAAPRHQLLLASSFFLVGSRTKFEPRHLPTRLLKWALYRTLR